MCRADRKHTGRYVISRRGGPQPLANRLNTSIIIVLSNIGLGGFIRYVFHTAASRDHQECLTKSGQLQRWEGISTKLTLSPTRYTPWPASRLITYGLFGHYPSKIPKARVLQGL